jgi:hypothetical protein
VSLLKNIECSVGDVALKSQVLVCKEIVDRVSLDITVAGMDVPILKLSLGDSEKIAKFVLDIFMVERFHSEDFVSRCSSVESH